MWSAKGGAGCSLMAAGAAVLSARRQSVLLVDLGGGDLPSILGFGGPVGLGPVGLSDWLGDPSPPVDALARMEVAVADNLGLLTWAGSRSAPPEGSVAAGQLVERFRLLGRLLATDHRRVIVDLGSLASFGWLDRSGRRGVVLETCTRSTLVSRLCYPAVAAALDHPRPDDVILVVEPGRALRPTDVSR
ncbi:MAG: hypothetical protein OER95_20205, partial [Acidimicrobiia bacterium]|nr:hypothetical protein [Acidimicrobiia bacterium]